MARLRLFAHLRHHAGTDMVEVDGTTVDEVVGAASDRFGPAFGAAADSARVWVNGVASDRAAPVADHDEISMLGPLVGASQTAGLPLPVPLAPVLVVVLAGLLFLSPAFFVAAAVGVLALWVWDVTEHGALAGVHAQPIPALVGVMAGTLVPLLWVSSARHLEGVGVAVAVAVIATFANAAVDKRARSVEGIGVTLMLSLVVTGAAASLSLVRLANGGTSALWVLLAVASVSVLASLGADRLPGLNILDPLSAGAVGAVLAGLIMALILGLDVVSYLLVSMLLALGIIAGRSFGSLMRTGRVLLVESAPGLVAPLDGPVLGAALLLHALVIFL